MCCRNSSLCDWSCITKVSSTYLLQSLGGCNAVAKALASNASIKMLATIGLTGEPMAAPIDLVGRTPLEIWSRCYLDRSPNNINDVVSWHFGSVVEMLCHLAACCCWCPVQMVWVWMWTKHWLHMMLYIPPFQASFSLFLLLNSHGVVNMVFCGSNQWLDDSCYFFCNPIRHWTNAWDYGSKGGVFFMGLLVTHRILV